MTYKNLIKSFTIFAKHRGEDTECFDLNASHDEIFVEIPNPEDYSIEEIRELASYEWLCGDSDDEYEVWTNYDKASDNELRELLDAYKGISLFV